ncbi:4775_t:CDS:2 [Ambispora leptoticha]|uniref:4775_t:CDS:1 n=1 Tax=Ambispora leptoticha TaxID=144679 RepID=A0A9N9I2N3_9GLOM|nr:4775_t:CDS:2 [Ambispora leptoticha]
MAANSSNSSQPVLSPVIKWSGKDAENQSGSEAIVIPFRTELDNLLNKEREH